MTEAMRKVIDDYCDHMEEWAEAEGDDAWRLFSPEGLLLYVTVRPR